MYSTKVLVDNERGRAGKRTLGQFLSSVLIPHLKGRQEFAVMDVRVWTARGEDGFPLSQHDELVGNLITLHDRFMKHGYMLTLLSVALMVSRGIMLRASVACTIASRLSTIFSTPSDTSKR